MQSTPDILEDAISSLNLHDDYNGYTGNCANIAVALREIALEEYQDDYFRYVIVDRPSHFHDAGPDHIAIEYNGTYLDSKGKHSRQQLLNEITEENNKACIEFESKSYITSINYYNQDEKNQIKRDILEYIQS